MGFFSKLKQGLGIGTMDAVLNVPTSVSGGSGRVAGDFSLTAKSDQEILSVKVTFERIRTWNVVKSRRNDNGNFETYTDEESRSDTLGSFVQDAPFSMKANETKTIPIDLTFQPITRDGAIVAAVGLIANLTTGRLNERYEYKISGKVDLKGVAFDPGDSKKVVIAE